MWAFCRVIDRYHFLRVQQGHAKKQGQGYLKVRYCISKVRLYFYIMLLHLLIQYKTKSLFYPHTPPSTFRLPTMSNFNNASPVAEVAVSVSIVILPSINKIRDDTVNIVKGKSEEGIPTWQCCWCGTTYIYLKSMK